MIKDRSNREGPMGVKSNSEIGNPGHQDIVKWPDIETVLKYLKEKNGFTF